MAYIKEGKSLHVPHFTLSFSKNTSALNPYRLRGMATDHNFQRRGYATDLMQQSFKELKKMNCDMVWCNARLVAIDFYHSIGFKIVGEIFDIEGIGPHYYMYKIIS